MFSALEELLPEDCRIQPCDQGMHILLWLPKNADDVGIAGRVLAAGLATRPISPIYAAGAGRRGLMLGFGGFPPRQLQYAGRLAGILKRNIARSNTTDTKRL